VNQYLVFVLLGFGVGSVYAAVAMGLVVTYKGTGIINFAAGAMGMWSAYVFDEARRSGNLMLPVVVVPEKIKLGDHVAFLPALLLALLSGAFIGLVAHFLVFRPLRKAPPLAKVVASVGLMLALQALVVIRFKSTPRSVDAILPNETLRIGGVDLPRDRLYITAITIVVGVVLWAYFRYARLGLATRGAAENERAASLARFSPQFLAGTTWVISSFVVGLLLTLAAPLNGLNTLGYVFAIVPALACALVGRLTSIGATLVAGLTLGAIQSEITLLSTRSWWPSWGKSGLSDAVPFIIVIVVLFVLGRSLPTRGATETQPLPEVIKPRNRPLVVIGVTAAAVVALLVTSGSYRYGIITSMIVAISALSLMVLTGYVGQISLATAALAGTAGFALSKLTTDAGWPFVPAALVSALVAAAFGILVGIPALRIRGAQLAVVTLAAAVALERFIFRNPEFSKIEGNLIPNASIFGIDLGVRKGTNIARIQFGLLVLAVLVVVTLAVGNLVRSATGRRFLAVRSNERAGAAVGINIPAQKLLAFGIASFLAGVSGVLIGYSRGQLSADSFATLVGVSYLAFAYLGGITSVSGSMVAGALAPLGIFFVIFDRLVDVGSSYQLLAGISLILTAIFNPIGIAGATRQNVNQLRARWRRGAAVPAPVVTAGAIADEPVLERERRAARPARPTEERVLLETRDLSVTYGGLRAVDDLSLKVRAGSIVGLIGPNGAGKTSFIDGLTGFTATGGVIDFDGERIQHLPAHQRARRGLARTWQSVELFNDLTVGENLRVASEPATLGSVLADIVHPSRGVDLAHQRWALELMGLGHLVDERPTNLSLGQQKLLGVARALAARPRLVLLDEPAAGLDTAESQALGQRLMDIVDAGITVFLVDHDMGLVLEVCDYVYVIEFGRLLAEGTTAEVRRNDIVIEAYLGETARQAKAAEGVGDLLLDPSAAAHAAGVDP
jgi:ABC-type branched-subunit amino acid transport system ATPase component/branched-subunit amino acid ABC-type transport system permease component